MKKNLLNLKMAAIGLGMMFSTAASAATFTAALSGNWSSAATWGGTAPTSLVSGDNIVIPAGISVNMDMDVTFTGGLLLGNTFNVTGTLTSTANHLDVTQGSLTGSGMIAIKRLTFSNTGSTVFTGTINVGTMVNSSSSLAFATIANVADSLVLESGILNLNTNGNVMLASNSTIRVNNGSLAIGGTGVLNANSAHNVMYVGTSKTSGLELTGSNVSNVWVQMNNNNQSLTLGNDFTINGNLIFSNGKLNLNGKKLTLMGDLSMSSSNAITSNASSELMIMGSGNLSSGLVFDNGSSINILTVNRSGATVKLMNGLNIVGSLNMMNGGFSLESGSSLTMNAGSNINMAGGTLTTNSGSFVGTAGYNVEYTGGANSTGGVELSGSGLNNVTLNMSSSSAKVMLGSNTTVSGSLNMTSGSIDLNGKNLTLNGTMSQGTASAMFYGNAASELALNLASASSNTLYFDQTSNMLSRLKVNLASNSGSVMLGSGLHIINELNLSKGKVMIGTAGDLVIASTGSVTNYDNNNYIIAMGSGTATSGGHLVMNVVADGSSWTTYPVGTEQAYAPVYLQQTTAGSAGNFMVSATNTLWTNGYFGSDWSSTAAAVNKTWFVEAQSGVNVNLNLKLGWTASAEMNSFNRTNAMLRHFTNATWDVTAAASASAGANGTFELTRNGLTSLSPFGVTDANATVGIKQVAASSVSFDMYPNPAKDAITVKSPGAASCKYELIDITGRTILSTTNSDSVNKFDVSKLEKGYYFVKVTDNENNASGTKRFIKE